MLNRKLTNYYPVKWSKCSAVFYKRNICQTIKRYFQSNLMITEVAQICHESMFTSPSANSIQLNSFRLPVNSNFHSTIKSEFLITTDAFAIIFPSYEIHDTELFWEVNAWHISHKKACNLFSPNGTYKVYVFVELISRETSYCLACLLKTNSKSREEFAFAILFFLNQGSNFEHLANVWEIFLWEM